MSIESFYCEHMVGRMMWKMLAPLRSELYKYRFPSISAVDKIGEEETCVPVVVLGMHRSGTSLTARALQSMGVDMGKRMIDAREGSNPEGFFESAPFVELNTLILALSRGIWYAPPSRDLVLNVCESAQIKALVKNRIELNQSPLWGWKDPRTILTFDAYFPLLKNARYVLCQRDESAVIKSLMRRNSFSSEYAQKLVGVYKDKLSSIKKINAGNFVEVSYERYFSDPELQLAELADFIGVDRVPENNFINADLRHF